MNAGMSVLLLIEAGLKATVLFAAAALVDRLLRRAPSAARHVVWISALGGALILAPLCLTLPSWRMPLWLDTVPGVPAALFAIDATAAGTSAIASAAPRALAPSPARSGIPWGSLALWSWLAGSALVMARMAAGAWAIRRIARRASAPPAAIAARAAQLAGACGVTAEVRMSAPNAMPMTCGILRARILLPAAAISWPPARLDAVLLHELAHVRRRDTLWHSVGSLACALFWPHPLAWRALRRALALRERAADDFVLARGARPSEYASSLLEIARSLAAPRLCRSAAMARPSQLEGRLLAILDGKAARGAASRGFAVLASACALATAILLAPFQPVLAQNPAEVEAAYAANDYDRALALSRDLLVSAGKRHGENTPEYARALVKAGNALAIVGDHAAAAQSFDRAAAVLNASAPDDPALPEALYRGGLYAGGRERIVRFESALAAARRTGRDDIAARVLHNLALLSQSTEAAQADRYFEEAILVQSRLNRPAILAAMLDAWAGILRNAGREAEAGAVAERARIAREQAAARQSPAPPRPVGVYRIGGGVQPPRLIREQQKEPEFSVEARAAKVQGTVVLYLEVGPDGAPRNVRVMRPLGLGLDEQAVRAVQQWRFAPGTKDGQPVAVAATAEVNFRLM